MRKRWFVSYLSILIWLVSLSLMACQPIQLAPATQSTAPAAAETSDEAANKAVVQRVYDEVFTGKDLSVLGEIFDPNLVIHDFETAAPPIDELIVGLPDLKVTIDRLEAAGDLVTAMVSFKGTHQGEFMGVAPTGNPVSWTHIDLLRVQDGKIAEVWHNVPTADILQQISDQGEMASEAETELIRTTERERLQAMVEADMEVANQLHADDFQLINPGGMTLSKEQFLGDVASGFVDFLVWEPKSEIEVRLNGDTAVIRYQSFTDVVVGGEKETVDVWHTDAYEKRDGRWQIVWEQSTIAAQ